MKEENYFRKALAWTLSAAVIAGSGLTSAGQLVGTNLSVSARDYFNKGEIDTYFEHHSLGIVGSMTGWGYDDDIPMTDIDGDGIYTGICKNLKAGSYEFKVRADNTWSDCWGAYEENEDRTMNSQINCHITVKSTTDLIVMLDTNGPDEVLWPVSYCTTEEVNPGRYGIVGSMTSWSSDIPMYEYAYGKYVGICKDVPAGQHEFKVRADGAWDDSWGVYEEEYDRTNCSQTNLSAELDETSDIFVFFDTTGDDDIVWHPK